VKYWIRLPFVYITVDRSFRSLILQAWPLLSLDKEQLTTAYLTQHIIETAGIWFIFLIMCLDTDVGRLAEREFDIWSQKSVV